MMGLFPLFCIRTVLVGAGYRTDAEAPTLRQSELGVR